ncbi:ABC transporter permease subunit [Gordonia sp. (in: high G+C Gram-positive bacteria)]|uniref:ABC transporter permease subunit n=1 Tax=Gordonia sp. (in: high G+C Gram-positive bacteria) TaxID=84139 RepID=UPI003C71A1CB
MTSVFAYLLLGLGNGAVYAALGLALVMTYKSSGVVNFATGAVALYAAYTFAFLRKGELLLPIPGIDSTIKLGGPWSVLPALIVAVIIAAIVGVIVELAVFRPMRTAPVVAKAVASIGVMLVLQALIALQVGSEQPIVGPIFAQNTLKIGDAVIPTDRLWLAAVIVGLAILAGLVLKFTRFGVATEAAAESEKGALLTGLSPDRISLTNWALSAATAGIGGIVISPIVPLNPIAYTMFIVPALAAALVGDFASIGITVGAGLLIGMLQSETTYMQSVWESLPESGMAEAVPLILILGFLLIRGRPLPGRGAISTNSLGRSPRPHKILLPTLICVALAVVVLLLTSGSLRLAVIVSMIFGIIALSQLVVTGYAGQVSLAQLTLAGTGAFALSRFTTNMDLPFPIAPLLAALVAMVIGVVVGLPALRVRGLPLMVATLALAVFAEAFWFRNPTFNGGQEGAPVKSPTLFGIDLGIGSGDGYPRVSFGILCLVVLTITALCVAALRRSRLGASMLAVRANERSAASAGIDVGATKLLAFAIASFIAGLGGALLAYQQTLAAINTYSVFAGIALFATIYIAGVTSITGSLIAGVIAPGALLFFLMNKYLSFGDYYMLASGILLIVGVATSPDGVAGRLMELRPKKSAAGTEVARDAGDEITMPKLDGAADPVRLIGDTVLKVENVSVKYGEVTAVNNVSFDLHAGEIIGLIGPNGAGKTTLVDAICGFAPAAGTVQVGSRRIDKMAPHRRTRAGLGRTFQDIELYDDLSVAENLNVSAGRSEPGAVENALSLLGITELADVPAADLSQGQRQLVSVARVLAGEPQVVLLDEPAAGLDTSESRWLGARLRAAQTGDTAMLLIDHDMDLVLNVCDRVIVLDLGTVIASGTPEEIRSSDAVIKAYLGSPLSASGKEDL